MENSSHRKQRGRTAPNRLDINQIMASREFGLFHKIWSAINLLPAKIKFKCQRMHHGFADCDTWDLSYYYTELIGQSLKRFLEVCNGIPSSIITEVYDEYYLEHANDITCDRATFGLDYTLCDNDKKHFDAAEELAMNKWKQIIQTIIDAFYYANPYNEYEVMHKLECKTRAEYDEYRKANLELGFNLLNKYIDALWW